MPIRPSQADAVILQRAFITGLVVWAVATAAFRLVGQHLLHDDPARLLILFAAVGAFLAILGPYLRHALGASARQADGAALAMIIPGMLLDAGATGLFPDVFSNMDANLAPYFGSLMLWGYGVAATSIAIEARIAERGEFLP